MEEELFGYEREEDINAGSDDSLFEQFCKENYND